MADYPQPLDALQILSPYRPAMDYELGGILYEVPRKPKFDRDFIMLSEFSELVGPMPLVGVVLVLVL